MPKENRADEVTMQERVYEVSRLLRRKPQKYIIHHITEKYKVDDRQARNYIKLARKEWKKYFEKLKGDGIAYHVTQNRDLKDKAMTDGDYKLAFDIAKEEAKLMGVYPAEKKDVKVEGEVKFTNAKQKLISKINSITSRSREDKKTE